MAAILTGCCVLRLYLLVTKHCSVPFKDLVISIMFSNNLLPLSDFECRVEG